MVTGGRVEEVGEFLASLVRQSFSDYEIIIVQQNADDRLAAIFAAYEGKVPLRVIRSSIRKINHSRALGATAATGDILAFPDDDCLYPTDLLGRIDRRFRAADLDILTGIALAPSGQPGSGRWNDSAGPITVANVWTSAIEFNLFIRRDLYERIGGFDQRMGLGTPFAAGDAQDLILRAQDAGGNGIFDPSLHVFHPDKRLTQVALDRAFIYAAGLGYVLRKHRTPLRICLTFLVRPAAGVAVSLIRARWLPACYYWRTLLGRLWGFLRVNAAQNAPTTSFYQSAAIAEER
jgi:glycosyltransferase involved in cell wall biosynthesis